MNFLGALYPLTEVQKTDGPNKIILRNGSLAWIGHLPTSGELEGPAL